MTNRTTRRNFVKMAGASTAGVFTTNFFTGQLRGANDKIQVGGIGIGNQGKSLLEFFLKHSHVIAVCDVAQPMRERALNICQRANQPALDYADFRVLLDRPDIDAVFIATPDHWHAYMTVAACKRGKDVYVEKPIANDVFSGRQMIEAARKYRRVVQVGTQQRSAETFQKAVEIVRSGRLGNKITLVKMRANGGELFANIGRTPDAAPPSWLDWDMWLGPAADPSECPFSVNRYGVILNSQGLPDFDQNNNLKRWSTFRITDCNGDPADGWEFAGGMVTDWGVHLADIPLWALSAVGPVSIVALGKNACQFDDDRVTPDAIEILYDFRKPDSMWTFEHNSCITPEAEDARLDRRGREHGIKFFGNHGMLEVSRYGYDVVPLPGRKLEPFEKSGQVIPYKFGRSEGDNEAHVVNFLDCVRSREKPAADIEDGHRATAMCHLGNAAYRTRQVIDWDPETETTGVVAAWPMLRRAPRKGWEIEV